ncbi:MAG: GMC family oxidoreductase [Acidobacteriaceae bacterium]
MTTNAYVAASSAAAMISLSAAEGDCLAAIAGRIFPADENSPDAVDLGVLTYIDRALQGAYSDQLEHYRLGLAAINSAAKAKHNQVFANCTPEQQDAMLLDLEKGDFPLMQTPPPAAFFNTVKLHVQEGLFSDPLHGGNRGKAGWRFLGHPGVWPSNTAEENLSAMPVTKGNIIQSIADLDLDKWRADGSAALRHYDSARGAAAPEGPADVVMIGVGAMGGIVAPVLAEAGLKVVGLEAGAWRTSSDFVPDELGVTFYCRAGMSAKFNSEVPRWRRNSSQEQTEPAMVSFGRMMDSVGGSVIHYGAWLRRFHPFHFKALTRVREMWGEKVLPPDSGLTDWPITYAELEPWYQLAETICGVSGDEANPFTPRGKPYPMPPLRPFRLGEIFKETAVSMGLHPYPGPVGMNSVPYQGRPASSYTAWSNGFGSFDNSKWNPSLSSIPRALETGNFDLRTNCRVVRILTDTSGHADGVEYIDANGVRRVQKARTVILSSFTFENARLLLLSGDAKHPHGLGNDQRQVGKYYMTKQFAHVDGEFPERYFNRHTGPNSQAMICDDFVSADFDSWRHGFVGGSTIGVENQFLPIQISREPTPEGVSAWGKPYKDFIRNWNHWGVVAIQSDAMPYSSHTLDLDPHYRDRSGLGLPLVRITYDLLKNERSISEFMMGKAEECLREMGAVRTWRGPMLTGVCSSHDVGGCRMGDDPGRSVVNADLLVHDTPGLYVFGGSVFPTCPGVNPNLTIWALVLRASEQLIRDLKTGGAK